MILHYYCRQFIFSLVCLALSGGPYEHDEPLRTAPCSNDTLVSRKRGLVRNSGFRFRFLLFVFTFGFLFYFIYFIYYLILTNITNTKLYSLVQSSSVSFFLHSLFCFSRQLVFLILFIYLFYIFNIDIDKNYILHFFFVLIVKLCT